MVTAVVNSSLNQMLSHSKLTVEHWTSLKPFTSYLILQSFVFLLNSRRNLFSDPYIIKHREASIPKLVLQFAEFLKYYFLNRLSIFYLPTCVGLQYGLKFLQWCYHLIKTRFSSMFSFVFVTIHQH